MNGREKRKRLNVRKEVKKGKSCGPCWYPAALHVSREYRRQHALLDRVISHVHGGRSFFLYSTCNRWYPVCRTRTERTERTERKRWNSIFCHAIFAPARVTRDAQPPSFSRLKNTLIVLIVFLAINLWTINFNDDYPRQGGRENSKVDD